LALVAATLNVYVEPSVSPVTVWVDAGVVNDCGACATPPRYGVTTEPVIGDPPSEGACHDTTADDAPGTATTPDGADGTPPTASAARGSTSEPAAISNDRVAIDATRTP
jgi:hypothetical protein